MNINAIPSLVSIIIYLVLLVVVFRQRGIQDRVARWLVALLAFSLLFNIIKLGDITNSFHHLNTIYLANLDFYANLLGAIFLMQLCGLFFHRKINRFWWILASIILISAITFEIAIIIRPFTIKIGASQVINGLTILRAGLITAWGMVILRILLRTLQNYRKNEFIITRPRVIIWSFGFLLISVGDLLLIIPSMLNGIAIQTMGVVIVAYIVLTSRLPDITGVFRKLTYTLFSSLFELIIYTSIFILALTINNRELGFKPVYIAFAFGLVFLLLLNPLLGFAKKYLRNNFIGIDQNELLLLRDFSKKINNILDPHLLSSVIIDSIGEWMPVTSGVLFMVDVDISDKFERQYRLVMIQKKNEENQPTGLLAIDSPIAINFAERRKSITLLEMETLPDFHSAGTGEINWFKSQNYKLFVPIFSMDGWIGLLALGSKKTSSPFTEAEIHLLEAISDQIAVGMKNARLVDSLVRVNNEFRKAYTAMEEANQKLERLDLAKSDFINLTSHELRTPLTVISGYSQMLREDPIYEENEYYRKVFDGIHEGSEKLQEILVTMVDMAKIDTRELILQKEPAQIKALIQDVYFGFRTEINDRNLVLSFEGLDDLPIIYGDKDALNKVFYHLISNAIKFTPDGGKVSITGSVIPEEDSRLPVGGLQIVVSDTGIGIDPRYQDLIFSKFYQTGEIKLHSSGRTKFKGGGPGLGLAIVKGIVQAHDGRVWAESPGYDEIKLPGSQFFVLLPTGVVHKSSEI